MQNRCDVVSSPILKCLSRGEGRPSRMFLEGFYLVWQVYPVTSWPFPTAKSLVTMFPKGENNKL